MMKLTKLMKLITLMTLMTLMKLMTLMTPFATSVFPGCCRSSWGRTSPPR